MDRFLILGWFIFVEISGYLKLRNQRKHLVEKEKFGTEFLNNFNQYVLSNGQDGERYAWLFLNVEKMQAHLGKLGIYPYYRAPFENHYISNYAILLNLLPSLRRSVGSHGLWQEYSNLIFECLIRYMGVLDDECQEASRELKNPIIWFREGIKLILGIPFSILASLDIIGTSAVIAIMRSRIFRFISSIAALLSFISAIVGLVIGWDQFIELLKRFTS